jgi:hypothetical protein
MQKKVWNDDEAILAEEVNSVVEVRLDLHGMTYREDGDGTLVLLLPGKQIDNDAIRCVREFADGLAAQNGIMSELLADALLDAVFKASAQSTLINRIR